MPAPFPHRYQTSLRFLKDKDALLSCDGAPEILGAPPVDFDGPEGRWSPEHLLLSSVNLCLMTTFSAIARKQSLTVLDYQADITGMLDRTKEGLAFTSIKIKATLEVYASDAERGIKALLLAKKHCLISNALKTPVELEIGTLAS
jgi:organic hydroperoxide reductase OsmC/OhrA